MNNLLANINRINEYDKSVVDDFKSLFLSHANFMTLREMIISTRNYEVCLLMCDTFDRILSANQGAFTEEEALNIEKNIIKLRLLCLDKTDRWNQYVEYFDEVFSNKKYYYNAPNEDDADWYDKYFIEANGDTYKIHFLYGDDRYDVIQRKIAKSMKSKNLGNLKHRPQSELTDEQIEQRYNQVIEWAGVFGK